MFGKRFSHFDSLKFNKSDDIHQKGSAAVSYFNSLPEPFDDPDCEPLQGPRTPRVTADPDGARPRSRSSSLVHLHETSSYGGFCDSSCYNRFSPVMIPVLNDDLLSDSGISSLEEDFPFSMPKLSSIKKLHFEDQHQNLTAKSDNCKHARKLFNTVTAPSQVNTGYKRYNDGVENKQNAKRHISASPVIMDMVPEGFTCWNPSSTGSFTKSPTGDYKRSCCMPVLCGTDPDLNCISPQTVGDLLNGCYSNMITSYHIVDCRYPYEFAAGHIRNAINIWQQDAIVQEFIHSDRHRHQEGRYGHCVIIFHCEFSLERGPKMSRFLRNKDRDMHIDCYPDLYYPEMYILQGGYKDFYDHLPELCSPQMYKPMIHPNHVKEIRHLRVKSKSWAGEKKRIKNW